MNVDMPVNVIGMRKREQEEDMCMGNVSEARYAVFFLLRNLKLKSFCGRQTQNKSGATIYTSEADDISLYVCMKDD